MILGTDRILVNNIQSQFSMFFFLIMMILMKISEIYLKISDKDIAFFFEYSNKDKDISDCTTKYLEYLSDNI